MGWAYGIVNGRKVGYSVESKCDYPGCNKKIDRGLSYCCGGTHGGGEYGCGRYFCEEHLGNVVEDEQKRLHRVCDECAKNLLKYGDFFEDPEKGLICKNAQKK